MNSCFTGTRAFLRRGMPLLSFISSDMATQSAANSMHTGNREVVPSRGISAPARMAPPL